MWADDGFYVTITVVGIAWAFAWMGVRISEIRTRKKALETGATPELMDRLFEKEEKAPSRYGALKWGLVVAALGLGVLAEAVFPYGWADPIAYGVVLVIGGLALIGYYLYMENRAKGDGGPDRASHRRPRGRPNSPEGGDATGASGGPTA